ncbi:hypothetical protein CCHR01_20003 [Colletotrichum chrysophilum]|uniref:Uncharacterized protein n=1 Tax=Colletotrichum chrysophilum TaxID=1836956 RepID=A0AAD9E9W3_9PEZI|nr:hypothetical protein CCHR01_20003 [Colletotrichum chrysophilum]
MKQKIRELEQQVNTQANMLAFLGEPAHPWISVETPQFHGVEGIDCSGPSQPLSPEASKAIPAPYTLSTTSPPHSIQGVTTKPAYVPHRGLVWSPEAVSGEAIDTSGAGDTYPNEKIGTPSPTSGTS